MRILVITAWYYPFIHPRAHRWTCLAEYWAAQGHEVHVVCARRRDAPAEALANGVRVHRTGFDSLKEIFYYWSGSTTGRGRIGAEVRRPGPLERLLVWAYRFFWKNLFFPDDACLWYFPARRRVRTLLQACDFDAVVSVSLPFTEHLVGRHAKRRFPGVRWLADIGDPFTLQAQPPNNTFLYGRISRQLELAVLENADSVVVTNAGAARAYREAFGAAAEHLAVIPPVWRRPSPAPADTAPVATGFRMGYFGALYAPVRTPDAFLDLLYQTRVLRPDVFARLHVHFYGEIFPEFFEKLNHAPGLHLHGLRSREEAWAAMLDVDALLNIGNNTAYQLPSKVVDYLASGKPVVHLSYVDEDPFLDFWGDAPGLLCLRVRQGKVVDADLPRWLAFVERPHPLLAVPDRAVHIRAYSVDAVAERYWALLCAGRGG